MRQWMGWTVVCTALALAAGLTGCGQSDRGYHPVPQGTKVKDVPHEHEHGPHGGHLVEFGEEEYHAEVTFDAKVGQITIYLLDSNAKNASPTDAKEITLNLAIDGKPTALKAIAVPQSGDPHGQSSRFAISGNADVKAHIKDEEDLKGEVSATIGGKTYSGKISHEH